MKPAHDIMKEGAVVQINPEIHDGAFKGCFLLVTDIYPWGVQGFISMPTKRGEVPGAAYYRAKWEEIEYVGEAEWIGGIS